MGTPITPLTTPPTRQSIGQDAGHARLKLVDAVGNLNTAVNALQTLTGTATSTSSEVNGNLSFGNISSGKVSGNLKTQMFTGTSPGANTPFTLNHNLGKVPNGAILIQSNVAATLYGDMTDQAWTSTTITLLLNQSSVNYVILVLG
jgi:hypothetical protein